MGDSAGPEREPYAFSRWSCGRCDAYDVDTARQMERTLAGLYGKRRELLALRQRSNVWYTLEVVPVVHPREPTPTLTPGLPDQRFCCGLGIALDIDLYVEERWLCLHGRCPKRLCRGRPKE